MYLPSSFSETDLEVVRAIVRAAPLATLVTLGRDGLEANPVPLLWRGTSLVGHLARPNPQWSQAEPGVSALACFTGPQGYVTPSWYPTKAIHGRHVPTWNYEAVHIRGQLIVHDDAEWVRQVVRALTEEQEAPRDVPWSVFDAPADYIEGLLKAIVGIEIVIEHVEGKRKLSQNRAEPDWRGVVVGLEKEETAVASVLARRVKEANEQRRQRSD